MLCCVFFDFLMLFLERGLGDGREEKVPDFRPPYRLSSCRLSSLLVVRPRGANSKRPACKFKTPRVQWSVSGNTCKTFSQAVFNLPKGLTTRKKQRQNTTTSARKPPFMFKRHCVTSSPKCTHRTQTSSKTWMRSIEMLRTHTKALVAFHASTSAKPDMRSPFGDPADSVTLFDASSCDEPFALGSQWGASIDPAGTGKSSLSYLPGRCSQNFKNLSTELKRAIINVVPHVVQSNNCDHHSQPSLPLSTEKGLIMKLITTLQCDHPIRIRGWHAARNPAMRRPELVIFAFKGTLFFLKLSLGFVHEIPYRSREATAALHVNRDWLANVFGPSSLLVVATASCDHRRARDGGAPSSKKTAAFRDAAFRTLHRSLSNTSLLLSEISRDATTSCSSRSRYVLLTETSATALRCISATSCSCFRSDTKSACS